MALRWLERSRGHSVVHRCAAYYKRDKQQTDAWIPGKIRLISYKSQDSKVHGTNMEPIWGGQVPGGPHRTRTRTRTRTILFHLKNMETM